MAFAYVMETYDIYNLCVYNNALDNKSRRGIYTRNSLMICTDN